MRGRKARVSPDATLATIVQELDDPEEFVRRVLQALGHERTWRVRISVSSNPRAPNYLLEEVMEGHIADGPAITMQSFRGRGHKELTYDFHESETWSTVAMTFLEVQLLLGQIRSPA